MIELHINKNKYETHDSWFYTGVEKPDLENEFYNLHRILNEEVSPNVNNQNSLFTMYFSLSSVEYNYERIVYTFLDVVADLGGVLDLILALLCLFMDPYTELSFNTFALETFY
jgi:hypothetical protein